MKSIVNYISERQLTVEEYNQKVLKNFLKDIYWDHNNLKDKTDVEWPEFEDILGMSEEEFNKYKSNDDVKLGIKAKTGIINERKTSWTVTIGHVFLKNNSSTNNNLEFIIAIPKNKNTFKTVKNMPLYDVEGHGLYGSKDKYFGSDKKEFQKTLETIIQNHLHYKK